MFRKYANFIHQIFFQETGNIDVVTARNILVYWQ